MLGVLASRQTETFTSDDWLICEETESHVNLRSVSKSDAAHAPDHDSPQSTLPCNEECTSADSAYGIVTKLTL